MSIRAVIFDIDGTLVDTNAAHICAWHEAFAKQGHDVPAERIRPEIGKGGDQLVPAILGADEERREGNALREQHDEIFLRMAGQEHFRVFPGTEALLQALRKRGLKVALATSSRKQTVDAIVQSAKFDPSAAADVFVNADDAEASKPAPDLVLAALDKLALLADQSLFIGDTTHDGEAAGRAGVPFVGVTCGGCATAEQLREAGARSVWRDPADLLAHLEEVLAIPR